jgi:hypothetical protein
MFLDGSSDQSAESSAILPLIMLKVEPKTNRFGAVPTFTRSVYYRLASRFQSLRSHLSQLPSLSQFAKTSLGELGGTLHMTN